MNINLPICSEWLWLFIPLAVIHIYFFTLYSLSFFAGGNTTIGIKWKFRENWGEARLLDASGRPNPDAKGISTIKINSPFALYQMFLNFFGAFVGWVALALILFKSPSIKSDNILIFLSITSVVGISGFMPNLLSRATSIGRG